MHIPKKRIFFITALILGVVGVGYIAFSANAPIAVPELFRITRERVAVISYDIVALTTDTNEKVAQINVAHKEGDVSKAVVLLRGARRNNANAYTRAFELSEQLKILAQSLGGISSARSQRLASEAIATELALVSEFIAYTQDLNQFFDRVYIAVNTGENSDTHAIAGALKIINARVARINELNKEIEVQMRAFDRSL